MERLEKQPNIQKFKNGKNRVTFQQAVNIDIPPARRIARRGLNVLTETYLKLETYLNNLKNAIYLYYNRHNSGHGKSEFVSASQFLGLKNCRKFTYFLSIKNAQNYNFFQYIDIANLS